VRWGIAVLLLASAVAFALRPEAEALLKQAEAKRQEARAAYPRAYPDRPLWKDVLELAQEAARLDPEAPEVWRFLAEVYTETGWWIRAAEAWERYLALGGAKTPKELAEVYRHLGYLAYERGDLEEAIGWYQKALEADPADAEAAAWLGRIFLELGDPRSALPFWERAARLDPNPRNRYFLKQTKTMLDFGPEAVSAFYKGYAAYEEGDWETALLFFKRAADLAPNWLEPYRWLGRIYLEQGMPREAVGYWQHLARKTRSPDAWHFYKLSLEATKVGLAAAQAYFDGIAAYEKGDLEKAEQAFQAATEANPNYARAWKWLGRVYYERGKFAEAAEAFRRVLELNPEDGQARYYLRLAARAAKR